jgi:hypothetical protein
MFYLRLFDVISTGCERLRGLSVNAPVAARSLVTDSVWREYAAFKALERSSRPSQNRSHAGIGT